MMKREERNESVKLEIGELLYVYVCVCVYLII